MSKYEAESGFGAAPDMALLLQGATVCGEQGYIEMDSADEPDQRSADWLLEWYENNHPTPERLKFSEAAKVEDQPAEDYIKKAVKMGGKVTQGLIKYGPLGAIKWLMRGENGS